MGNLVSLTELISSGKSGSFFYFTGDCKKNKRFLKLKIDSKIFIENDFKSRVYFFKKDNQTIL